MTRERTLDNGSTVRLEDTGHDRLVILDYPDAPADMRNREAGRIINGGFQQAPYSSAFALRPATLRALADLMEGSPMPDQTDRIAEASVSDLADLIREALAKELIEWTGECACDEAYTSRSMVDPHCVWHAVGGAMFSEEAAEVIAAALTAGGSVEWGAMKHSTTGVFPANDQEEALSFVHHYEEGGAEGVVVARVVGPWKAGDHG